MAEVNWGRRQFYVEGERFRALFMLGFGWLVLWLAGPWGEGGLGLGSSARFREDLIHPGWLSAL